jgi:ketosteroid isomerase-like protein
MPDTTTLERFIARVESGAHAEAIAEFYAAGASMQENEQPPRAGRDLLVANERKVLARTKTVRSTCIRPVLVDGDRVAIRWLFEFEFVDGRTMRLDEIAWQRWSGDRIVEEKFFYDPAQLAPPRSG